MKHFLLNATGAALVLLLIPCPGISAGEEDLLKVTFLDVRQGDSQVIQTPSGKVILIDGGQSATRYSSFDAGESAVLPYLESEGIKKIDLVINTHPDYDHTGGLIAVLKSDLEIGEVLDTGIVHTTGTYQDFMKEVQRRKLPYRVPDAGEILDWGEGLEVQIIGPSGPPERRSHLNLNNNSVVVRLEYGDVSFLFTGDAEHEQEDILISSGARLKSTILKSGHHGSRTASGPRLYYLTDPEVVTISAGKRNKFDHPHWDPVKLFRETGARIYRTDYHGNITVITDGKDYEVITGYLSDPEEESD